MWKLKGTIPTKQASLIAFVGLVFFASLWHFITLMEFVPRTILPNPVKVAESYGELISFHHKTYGNMWDRLLYSMKLNLMGYAEATVISVIVGFLLGLFAPIRAFFGMYLNAARYVPLTAITGIMVAWFGLHDTMKVQFLSLGILVYMIPTVAARVQETLDVHLHTAQTLGATPWQKVLTIFFPDVLRRVSTDIINLTAISWTYIIIAEMMNNTGGIGAMMWECSRRSRYEQMYALLFLIIAVGIVQDKVLTSVDKMLFPDKYNSAAKNPFMSNSKR